MNVRSLSVRRELMRRMVLARLVLSAAAFVCATTLLIYPLIRRLVGRLSDMSIHLLDANIETLQVLGSAIAKRDSDTDAHNCHDPLGAPGPGRRG